MLLAVDTACGTCSVAVADAQGALLAFMEERDSARQAERLLPMMEEVLHQMQLTYSDLSALATTIGPGSFTGVRIGMAAMLGISLATGLPVYGITTLEAIAWEVFSALPFALPEPLVFPPVLVLLNAMRGQVYAQRFAEDGIPINEPALIDVSAIPSWLGTGEIIAGNCSAIVREILPEINPAYLLPEMMPHASQAAALAAKHLASGIAPADNLAPLYIRAPDAKLPKPAAPL